MPQVLEQTIPAPTLGWNAKSALDQMDPRSALVLDNIIPRQSYAELRAGHRLLIDGLGGPVETLISYAGSAGRKLLACAGGKIWDITPPTGIEPLEPVELASGLGSDRWQWCQFKDYVILVNGVDTPRSFNGSVIAELTMTGITDPTKLVNVTAFKSALYFAAEDDAHFWYLPVGYIQGALVDFDLSPLALHGGKLTAILNWTRDSGLGPNNYVGFLMSSGDVLIYAGSHPSVSTDWSIVGTYRIAPPLGRRCAMKFADDVLLLTQDGYVALSRAIGSDRSNEGAAVSDLISGAVRQAIVRKGTAWGWEAILYPRGQLVLVNVPTASDPVQHVLNSSTGGWCRFTGMAALTWGVYADDLYFGSEGGAVYQADYGTTDDGAAIVFDGKTAFSFFGSTNLKRFMLVRPTVQAQATLNLQVDVDTDFADTTGTIPPVTSAAGTAWGSPWGSPWSPALQPRSEWQVVTGLGRSAAMRMRGATRGISLQWLGASIRFEEGMGL
jgi:hypothetical protein